MDITSERNVQWTDILVETNVQWTEILVERNVQGTDSCLQDEDHTDGHYITLFAEQLKRTFKVFVKDCKRFSKVVAGKKQL